MRPNIGNYLEQQILSASPLELVVLSYRAAVQAVRDARRFLAEKNIPERVRCINRAHAILAELYRALDFKVEGNIAKELGRLYDYMMRQLLAANFEQSDAPLTEVQKLLTELQESWEQIAVVKAPAPAHRTTPAAPQSWGMSDAMAEQGAYSFSF